MWDGSGEAKKTIDTFRKSRVALRERGTEMHIRFSRRHIHGPRCRKCERKEMMGCKSPMVSRSQLSTETRFTTAQRRTPAAPVHAFTLHPLKLSVLLETGLKSGDFIPPAPPQLLGAHSTRCHPASFRGWVVRWCLLHISVSLWNTLPREHHAGTTPRSVKILYSCCSFH